MSQQLRQLTLICAKHSVSVFKEKRERAAERRLYTCGRESGGRENLCFFIIIIIIISLNKLSSTFTFLNPQIYV